MHLLKESTQSCHVIFDEFSLQTIYLIHPCRNIFFTHLEYICII